MDVDIAHFIWCLVSIDWRMNDGVVEEIGSFLRLVIPSFSVFMERLVEIVICAKRRQKGSFVIGRSAHPAVGSSSPLSNGIPTGKLFFRVSRRAIESMGKSSIVGRHGQHILFG